MYSLFAILFAIIIAIFSVQNATPVNVKFIVWQFENVSLVLVIIASAIIGGLIVFSISLFKTFSLKRQLGCLRKDKVVLEEEIDRLTALAATKDETFIS